MKNFYMGSHLITGADCIEKNADVFPGLGKRCHIITGRSGAAANGPLPVLEEIFKAKDILYTVQIGSYENPSVSQAMEAGLAANAGNADFLIGIGGGSVLDLTKAASVFAANPKIDEAGFYSGIWETTPLPTVLVGTTSGTGSEVTSVSVLMDSAGKKHSIHNDLLYGRYSFGDPRFTISVPESVTVSTCIDALSHCVESYFTRKVTSLSKLFSVAGVKLFLATVSGRDSLVPPLSYEVRKNLYDISILGGMAINITGTTFPHSVGYYFTERFHIPHGYASALFLPELLRHAEKNEPELWREFHDAVSCSPETLHAIIEDLIPDSGIHLTDEDIDRELPRWNNNSVKNCCSEFTLSDIRQMLAEKFL